MSEKRWLTLTTFEIRHPRQLSRQNAPETQKTSAPRNDGRSFVIIRCLTDYVLMCFRLPLRAFALAGRLPWFAFFNFLADLAISILSDLFESTLI
jgi:hypothetical protein